MKLDNHQSLQDKTEIHAQKEIEKHKQLFTSTVLHKGHTMWEIDCMTGEIREAQYKEEKVVFVSKVDLLTNARDGVVPKVVKDIDCKPNCLYIGALNKKSAQKKFKEYLLQNIKIKQE